MNEPPNEQISILEIVGSIVTLIRDTIIGFGRDKGPLLAAALAYYSMLSIAPLLVISVVVAGVAFGEAAVEGRLVEQIEGAVGPEIAAFIQLIIENASQSKSGLLATVVSVVVMVLSASRFFVTFKTALNTIWRIEPQPGRGNLFSQIKAWLFSVATVLGIGFFLLVSLSISTGIAALNPYLADFSPIFGQLSVVLNIILSLIFLSALFAFLFKALPDADIAWRDVWLGAVFTAVLFTLGEYLIGLYLSFSSLGSAFGAAGSLIIILVWVNYSAQIVLFGAEFIKVYANKHGSQLLPSKNALLVSVQRNNEHTINEEQP